MSAERFPELTLASCFIGVCGLEVFSAEIRRCSPKFITSHDHGQLKSPSMLYARDIAGSESSW